MGEAMEQVSPITCEFKGKQFYFESTPTAPALVKEIFSDHYKVFDRGITFSEGDVILDIGANEGMFSVMMAKMFPFTRVIAYEPVPRTFFQMVRNIGLNGVTNIEPHCTGVAKEHRPGVMNVHKTFSGGSSLVDTFDRKNHDLIEVDLISLDEAMYVNPQKSRIRLLKIDIEGGEYDAIYGSKQLDCVDYVVGEFHINERLIKQGYDINELATYIGSKTTLVYYERCRMAE